MKRFILTGFLSLVTAGLVIAQSTGSVVMRIAKFKGDKLAAISYTFDDGLKEHYTKVAPELEKRGFRGTFWVNGNTINRNDPVTTDTTRTTWTELKGMASRGHEISNHGWSHKNLTKLDDAGVMKEIEKNDSIIIARIGMRPITYCYAGNSKNDRVIRLASIGRVGTRTFQRSIGSKTTEENLRKWVDELIEKGEWGVGMTHGISYGYDAFRRPQVLWNHLDYVKSLENKIWIGTFRQVAAYERERDSVQLEITAGKRYFKVNPKHTLNKNLYNESLTMVVEIYSKKFKSVKQEKKNLLVHVVPSGKTIFDFNPNGGPIYLKY